MTVSHKGVLLESGTNELEIIVFEVGRGLFGINVMKVREIIQPLSMTLMPHSHPNVEGIIRLREEIMPVIDLAKAIGFKKPETPGRDKLIVAELNQVKVAFHVHSVSRIHRISWEQIEKPGKLAQGLEDMITGVIKMEETMILLLDYEKIVFDLMPGSGFSSRQLEGIEEKDRTHKNLLVAEDSPILRQLLKDTLNEAGYDSLVFTENGKEALEYLEGPLGKTIDLLLTDIEMPVMDGHHLTKRVKEDGTVKEIPVVIFSSLISGDLYHKGEQVGADAQVSKPDIGKLVAHLDRLLNI
ncbi:chemotaxis protein [Salipaludibacillus aurantiacus]|uniref:Two-component system, chemotaxis family, response regulator CheV n=1 Tax=Salipaludibacillus aurantiacus TaxID=1601833 RepID=A0A1H9WE12_9BACI|nr:chemotaxis protein [Salipaludibacillus aurantiacus]SES32150.1 two-component system, chemotaxis family, response regulator CheV [Salipaludibacillus aurantiacus]